MENRKIELSVLFSENRNGTTKDFWFLLIPYFEFFVSNASCNEAVLNDLKISDETKHEINKLFRKFLGANCKVPHPEVEAN